MGLLRQAPMRSLRRAGRCRVSVRAGPTYRFQDSPRGRQPVLMESNLARARTHTLTSSPPGLVDRQRPTSILAAGSGGHFRRPLGIQLPVRLMSRRESDLASETVLRGAA
jgi:hypothetical protein